MKRAAQRTRPGADVVLVRRYALLALLLAGCFALGAYAPLWNAMPWAVHA